MKIHLPLILLILSAGGLLHAQDAVTSDGDNTETPPDASAPADPASEADTPPATEEEGPAIPVAYDPVRYDSVWDKNPFTRKVVPIAAPTINWGQDWALAGMSQYNGKVRISIRNKQTNEIKRVTKEPKEGDEFRLIEAKFNRSRKEAAAIIAKGDQQATLKYDENAAPVTINNTARAASAPQGGATRGLPGTPGGQPPLAKPVSPTSNGRVFNAPNLPGGVSQPGGMVPGAVGGMNSSASGTMGQPTTGVVNPNIPGTAGLPNSGNVPIISRRRQLIPAPVVNPPQSGNP